MVRSKPLLSFLFATCLVVPAFSQLEPSWPPDSNAYTRKAIAEDKRPAGNLAIKALQFGTPTFPDVFIRDTVVSNVNPSLTDTDTFRDGEPSIAINRANTNEIVITAFSGFNWTNPGTNPSRRCPALAECRWRQHVEQRSDHPLTDRCVREVLPMRSDHRLRAFRRVVREFPDGKSHEYLQRFHDQSQ